MSKKSDGDSVDGSSEADSDKASSSTTMPTNLEEGQNKKPKKKYSSYSAAADDWIGNALDANESNG
jgi:hypothetical protein